VRLPPRLQSGSVIPGTLRVPWGERQRSALFGRSSFGGSSPGSIPPSRRGKENTHCKSPMEVHSRQSTSPLPSPDGGRGWERETSTPSFSFSGAGEEEHLRCMDLSGGCYDRIRILHAALAACIDLPRACAVAVLSVLRASAGGKEPRRYKSGKTSPDASQAITPETAPGLVRAPRMMSVSYPDLEFG